MASQFKPPGSFRSAADFLAHLHSIDPTFHCDLHVPADGPLAQSQTVYDRRVGNRFAIQPMEGWDATTDGQPSELTFRRWGNFGRSGAKLIWGGEAVAVLPAARANPNQLFINPAHDNVAVFRQLRQHLVNTHEENFGESDDLYIGLQLTHSGRFAKPTRQSRQSQIAFYHPLLSQKFNLPADHPPLTDPQLQEIAVAFVSAAEVAQQAGFDFVDIKACHGYLMHELLAAHTRPGPYGGSFENRTRLLREVIEAITVRCPSLRIGVRLSLTDLPPFVEGPSGVGQALDYRAHLPWRFGFGMDAERPCEADFDEPFQLMAQLQSMGVRLLNVAVGSPYACPHLQRPATFPPSDGYLPPQDPLRSVFQQILAVRNAKKAFPEMLLVGSGYSYLQDYLPHVAQAELAARHVDFVGLGRMVLSYPTLPADVLAGKTLQRKRVCRTFSDCTTGPRNDLISGCFPLDPFYKQMDHATTVKQLRQQSAHRLDAKTQASPKQPDPE